MDPNIDEFEAKDLENEDQTEHLVHQFKKRGLEYYMGYANGHVLKNSHKHLSADAYTRMVT